MIGVGSDTRGVEMIGVQIDLLPGFFRAIIVVARGDLCHRYVIQPDDVFMGFEQAGIAVTGQP